MSGHAETKTAATQMVVPFTLLRGDVVVAGGHRWRLHAVELRPCPIAPKVHISAMCLPDGPFQSLLLDLDRSVPVEVGP